MKDVRVEAHNIGHLWDADLVDDDLFDCDSGSGAWIDITGDVRGETITTKWGIGGSTPRDLIAQSGQLSLVLDNGVGETEGQYSPNHPNVRNGWSFGTPLRLSLIETYPEAVIASKPWGYWRLDESPIANGAALIDLSGHNRHGHIQSNTTMTAISDVPVSDGRAMRGGQTRLYASSQGERLNDVLTCAFWFRGTNTTAQFGAAGPGNPGSLDPVIAGWNIDKRGLDAANSTLSVRIDTTAGTNQVKQISPTGGITGVLRVWDGQWRFLTLVLNVGQWKWYANAVLIGSGTYNHGDGFGRANTDLWIHRAGNYLNDVDEVALWDRELTAAEIETIFSAAQTRSLVKHLGTVGIIDPEPGIHGDRTVAITSYDAMYRLLRTKLPDLPIATNLMPAQLIEMVLDALPAEVQPDARLIATDPPGDEIPLAFDGQATQVGPVFSAIASSTLGACWVSGDGTFVWQSRHGRAAALAETPLVQADDVVLHAIRARSDQSEVYQLVETTTHPRHVEVNDPAVTIVYADSGSPRECPPGTSEHWITYQHPDDKVRLIAARDVISTLVPGEHYEARAAKDGSGPDLSGSVSIGVVAFATTARVTVTNLTGQRVYLVTDQGEPFLWIVGNAILDEGERKFRAGDTNAERRLSVDLPLADSDSRGQAFADWLLFQHSDPTSVQEIELRGTSPFLRSVIKRLDVSHHVTVTEAMTGVTLLDALVNGITITIRPDRMISARIVVTPIQTYLMWELGVSALIIDGEGSTILGV